jgi:hypothetical protein
VYQFKAIVTDVAGNSAEVLSAKVTVDNTAPVAGVLSFNNLTDTGYFVHRPDYTGQGF